MLVPTAQQAQNNCQFLNKGSMKIEACAGSGKTTQLSMLTNITDNVCLYLAFNKAAALDASYKMANNTTCKTTHSLAYASHGHLYRHKLTRPKGQYVNVAGTVKEIKQYFNVQNGFGANALAIAGFAKSTVTKFEQSGNDSITMDHLPHTDINTATTAAKLKGKHFSKHDVHTVVLQLAKNLWEERTDILSPVLITHDSYLKMYQLSKPVLKYKTVFLDEAQDTSDCVIDIINNQDCQVVAVGDTFQQIYGWRGAVNALEKVQYPTSYLSQSFRYGQAIADIASSILDYKMVIKGSDTLESTVGKVDKSRPYTQIFRTNIKLLQEGVKLLQNGMAVKMCINSTQLVKLIESMIALKKGDLKNVKHEDICIFESWEDLQAEVEITGGELQVVSKIILDGSYINILQQLSTYKAPNNPHVTLITAHKSKGMEYEQVVLADDFPSVYNSEKEYTRLPSMERNLLYVASTRAMKTLQINSTVEDILYENAIENEVVQIQA